MRAIQGQLPDTAFVAPSASDIAGVPTTVPGVSGVSVESATQQLEAAGFTVSYGGYVDSAVAEGLVAYSSPGTGAIVPSGSTVTIYQSTGRAPRPQGGGGGGGGNDRGDDSSGNGNGNGNNGRGNGNGNGRR
jgi:hypothetical protein